MLPLLTVVASVLAGAAGAGVVEGSVHFEQKTLFGSGELKGEAAVVFLEQTDEPVPPPPRDHPKMVQKDKAFSPRLLVVTVGTEIDFPNDDLIFHNVFSLSQGSEFDLGVYRRGTSKTVRFNKPGVVDVFCNIHPDMIGSILVVRNGHWARVGPDGKFRLEAPRGKAVLVVYWDRGVVERREIDVGAGVTTADFTLVDTGQKTRHLNKYGQQYGRYK